MMMVMMPTEAPDGDSHWREWATDRGCATNKASTQDEKEAAERAKRETTGELEPEHGPGAIPRERLMNGGLDLWLTMPSSEARHSPWGHGPWAFWLWTPRKSKRQLREAVGVCLF